MTATARETIPWTLDATHSEVEFSVRHLMIANVKGRFSDPTGTVTYDPAEPDALAMRIEIPTGTVDTRNAQRDTHLRSADFFKSDAFPTMIFTGKRVIGDVTGSFTLVGDLTIRGKTHTITLDVTAEGRGDDPWGNERLGFSATGKVNRQDYDLHWNQAMETGGVVVGDDVKIIINAELMRKKG